MFVLDLLHDTQQNRFTLFGINKRTTTVKLPLDFFSSRGLDLAYYGNLCYTCLENGNKANFVPSGNPSSRTSYQFFQNMYEKLAITKGIVPFTVFTGENHQEGDSPLLVVYLLFRRGTYQVATKEGEPVLEFKETSEVVKWINEKDPDVIVTHRFQVKDFFKQVFRFPARALGRTVIDIFHIFAKFGVVIRNKCKHVSCDSIDELLKLDNEIDFVNLLRARCEMFKVSPFDVHAMGVSFQFARYLKRQMFLRAIVWSPSKSYSFPQPLSGGYIEAASPGLYTDPVYMIDFKSMYPTIIKEFKLCYSSLGFFPAIAEHLMEERQKVTCRFREQNLKFLANMIFGTVADSRNEFYNYEIASKITSTGSLYVRGIIQLLLCYGYTVLYTHTDSVFFSIPGNKEENLQQVGESVIEEKLYSCNLIREHPSFKLALQGISPKFLLINGTEYVTVNETLTEVTHHGKSPIFPYADRVIETFFRLLLLEPNTTDEQLREYIRNSICGINETVAIDDLAIKRILGRNINEYNKQTCTQYYIKAAWIIQKQEQRDVLANEVITYYKYKHGVSPYKDELFTVDYTYYQNELDNYFYRTLAFLPCCFGCSYFSYNEPSQLTKRCKVNVESYLKLR